MSKKLQGNGLFESSRMMLPEHKEAYIVHQHRLHQKTQPELDEQEIERISRLIAESLQQQTAITLVLHREFDRPKFTGIVTFIDQHKKSIKLSQDNDHMWIQINDIINAVSQ